MWEDDVRIVGVKMKFIDTNRTGNGEGKPLCTCICTSLITDDIPHQDGVIFLTEKGYIFIFLIEK